MENDTPILVQHTEAAKALTEKIRALRADVPRFVHDFPEERRKLVQKYTLPEGFLESAGVSLQTFERLEAASGTEAAKLRDAFSYALAYDAVVKEAFAFARSVAFTIRVQLADAGASALDIYAIARRLSKRKDGAELIPFVEDMQKKLAKRGRPRKKNSKPAPEPVVPATPSDKA